MTTNYFDPDGTAKVTVPVKRVGERWEFFYGGDVPVREGTLGELTINANQITDDRFQKQVTQETVVKILDEGAQLMVALSDQSKGGNRVGAAWPNVSASDVPTGTTRFEPIRIGPERRPAVAPGAHGGQAPKGGLRRHAETPPARCREWRSGD